MHAARHKQNHAHIGRTHVPVEARAPALITLPLSMPSIPLLGPLITPFIAGTNVNQPATSPSTPTPTPVRGTTLTPAPTGPPVSASASASASAPTPPPTTPTQPASDNGEANSGDNGRSDDGFSSPSSSIDLNPGIVNVGGAVSVGHGISTGSSSPNLTDVSGNASTGADETENGPSDDSPSTPSPNNGSNLNGSLPGAAADVNVNQVTAESPGSGSIISGNTDTAIYKVTASSMKDFPGSTALPDPNGATNTSNPASNDVRTGLSGGAIAGMVIVITLGLLVVMVILLRGRYRQRRSERRIQWWNRFGTRLSTESEPTAVASRSDRLSFRSSFETTIDHAQTPRLNISFDDVPSLPPMAEIRGSDNIQLFSPSQPMPDSPMLITFDNSQPSAPNHRTSIQISTSTSSGSHRLVIPTGLGHDRETSSLVSVRPFSPSESFSFPMPPKTQSGESRPTSNATLYSTARSCISGTAVIPVLPSNPFADPSDPFSDPASPNGEVAEVEAIQRAFKGTCHDELTVTTADSVKVLHLFDDGWALVEKLPAFEDILVNEGKNVHGTQGLIPIDCFRSAGQDISTFFPEKQVANALYQGHQLYTCRNGKMSYSLTP